MLRFVAEYDLEANEGKREDDTLSLQERMQVVFIVSSNILEVVSSEYKSNCRSDWHGNCQ